MASTISTINVSLVEQKVAEALRYFLPVLKSFSYAVDASGDRIKSDVIYVPIATDPSAQSKTAGTTPTADGTVAGTSVTLSNHYSAAWDAKESAIAGGLFQAYWADKIAGAMYSVAKQVCDAALGVLTKANFGDADADKLVVAAADFGQKDLGDLWGKAAVKIKQREISLGLNAAYTAALLGDSQLGQIFATDGSNFVKSAILPNLIGMNTWAYGAFPSNSQSLGGAVFGKAAILVGVAPVAPLAASGEGNIIDRRIITDADSGISALYTSYFTGGGTVTGECELLYGVAKGQDAVIRVVSA